MIHSYAFFSNNIFKNLLLFVGNVRLLVKMLEFAVKMSDFGVLFFFFKQTCLRVLHFTLIRQLIAVHRS